MTVRGAFDRNVFINCPFDKAYRPLLRPLLFTVLYLGLKPRIALEAMDSGQPRLEKIVGLIRASKYSIHDLSRLRAARAGDLFRLNMPFELGIDFRCRTFGNLPLRRKRTLVLEAQPYRYRAAFSDLSGCDIKTHGNKPQEVVAAVRQWMKNECGLDAPAPTRIWGDFNDFMAANYDELTEQGFSKRDIESLAVGELMGYMKRWIVQRS